MYNHQHFVFSCIYILRSIYNHHHQHWHHLPTKVHLHQSSFWRVSCPENHNFCGAQLPLPPRRSRCAAPCAARRTTKPNIHASSVQSKNSLKTKPQDAANKQAAAVARPAECTDIPTPVYHFASCHALVEKRSRLMIKSSATELMPTGMITSWGPVCVRVCVGVCVYGWVCRCVCVCVW